MPPIDVSAGTITFTLSSTNNGPCAAVTNTLSLSFFSLAIVNAGINQLLCSNAGTIGLNGASTNMGSWITDGSGTFIPNNNFLNATYSITAADILAGSVSFTLTSSNSGFCPVVQDSVKIAFQNFIRGGGSFVGIHAASDTEKDWPWYNNLVGAYFKGHPKPQNARYNVVDKTFPAVSFMPDTINRFEEIYNFYNFKKELVKVVMTVDEKSYSGGNMGDFHPIAWYHKYEAGKSFFTAWGHHPETFKEELFLKHITAAIMWAMKK